MVLKIKFNKSGIHFIPSRSGYYIDYNVFKVNKYFVFTSNQKFPHFELTELLNRLKIDICIDKIPLV